MSKEVDKTVHIVGGFHEYSVMFHNHGWTVVDNVDDADLVQFCGGIDVTPALYGEKCHRTVAFSIERDTYERGIYDMAVTKRLSIAGICRGAQFLHVMNGGKLWQDVNCHALSGTHEMEVEDVEFVHLFPKGLAVTSTHHQMMREGPGRVIAVGYGCTRKEDMEGVALASKHYERDLEVVYHKDTNSLCYQPHPEYFQKLHACQRFYFQLIKKLMLT